ncbi:MAG: hypothetical protein GY810_19005 [Aureispira sp.]|nr:hypothetical protein [Aureispira sp.]
MTIDEAYQKMQNTYKVSHKKLPREIDYLQLVIMPQVIDDCANIIDFEALRKKPIFSNGWKLYQVK